MQFEIIAVVTAICTFLLILLIGLLTSLLREQYRSQEPKAPYSFSRVQLWTWTLVIVPLFALNWGLATPEAPSINPTSLVLLSISGAMTLTSTVITQVHINSNTISKLKNDSKGFFYDILTDDEGNFSIGRLQNFVFTFVFVIIYITYFFSRGYKYPDFEPYVYTLMGISSGTYLLGKSLHK